MISNVQHRLISGLSADNNQPALCGILTKKKKNARKRIFTAVYVHTHKVAINLLVNELQKLLCKNKCLLDGWVLKRALYNINLEDAKARVNSTTSSLSLYMTNPCILCNFASVCLAASRLTVHCCRHLWRRLLSSESFNF